jgi:type I restriction enzyme S subunit
MKQGWELKTLGEVATFSQGIQVGLELHLTEPKEGYVRFIRIVDYTQNTQDIRYIPDPGEKYFVNEDDIVMVRYGTPGLIGRGKAGVIANNLFRIKIERKDLTNNYLTLFLSQDNIQNYLSTQGSATMPALNFGQLNTVEVKFPSVLEQQRIVAILDEVFEAIAKAKANAEQNLKNAKELFESYLQNVFEHKGDSWEERTLGENAFFSQGIQVGLKQHLTEPKSGYVRFIRIVDYTQNTDDVRYVPDPGGKYFVNEDDIVMVRYGTPGLIGRGKAGVIANNLFKITIENKELSKDFLCLCLSQKHIQTYLSTQGSATMPALNFGQLKTVVINYPSLKEQSKIVAKLLALSAETKKLETIYQQKINDLEELKKSVLQKAFAGELKNTANVNEQLSEVNV